MSRYIMGLILMALTMTAFAGDKGNGGYSLVCRNENGKINSAELLDIYEGKILHNLDYQNNDLEVDSLILVALNRTAENDSFYGKMARELEHIQKNTIFVPEGHELELTEDAFPIIKKKGCEFEQLANYTVDEKLVISEEIYNKLDNLNKAALYIHEAVFAIRRKALNETSSFNSRKLTAHLISSNLEDLVLDRMILESLQRHDSFKRPCGLIGTIDQRIEDCSYKQAPRDYIVLVTRTLDQKEVYKDLVTGLLWGDRLPSRIRLSVATRICSNYAIPELGYIKLDWRLPTIGEWERQFPRIQSVLPNMYGDGVDYLFWSSTSFSIYSYIINGSDGDISREFGQRKTASARCVSMEK